MTSSNMGHSLVLAGWDILLPMLIFVVVVAVVILSIWNSNFVHIWYWQDEKLMLMFILLLMLLLLFLSMWSTNDIGHILVLAGWDVDVDFCSYCCWCCSCYCYFYQCGTQMTSSNIGHILASAGCDQRLKDGNKAMRRSFSFLRLDNVTMPIVRCQFCKSDKVLFAKELQTIFKPVLQNMGQK